MEPDKLVYPLSRYWYSDGYRFYYAYGNTPAQDFLQNCSGEKEPTVLVLGCGDIRSCFYSLWKNFDVNSRSRFDGVHFVLNDISAAVLARNVLFLYLCLRMPEEESELKKWLSGMWAIWHCHELYPDHDKLLHDSLDALCKYSEDWSNSDNPLHSIVKFTSSTTLCEICKIWKMWLERDVDISSVREMQASRHKDFVIHGNFFKTEADISNFVLGITEIPFEMSSADPESIEAMKSEVMAYCKTGSVYAENCLDLQLPSSQTFVNFTLFERDDGKYSLHYRSMPFSCYYQTVCFTSNQLRSSKFACHVKLPVRDEHFKSLPYLANSVQQFSLWLQSAHKVFTQKQNIHFTLDCSNAMTFCNEFKLSKKVQKFDLIYTSNLMDHLGPPNLVLSAIPLLREHGYLLTSTLGQDPLSSFSQYLMDCFGFDSKLFPILLGVRCINYEGDGYASPVAVRPAPFTIRDVTCAHYEKVQVWEKVPLAALPLVFSSGQPLTDAIAEALVGCVRVSVYPLLKSPRIPQVANHLCVETAVKVFETFMSNCCADFSPQFWKPLSDALHISVKPYLHSLQTQLLLHGIHMHLTVTEEDCPMCLQKPVSSSVGLFCVRAPIQIDFHTPKFFAAVHKEGSDSAEYLCNIARESGSVNLFDCVSTSADNSEVIELYFYAPLRLSSEGYKATLILVITDAIANINVVSNMPNVSTEQLMSRAITHSIFKFSQSLPSHSRRCKLASFGTVASHMSNGDTSEVTISLLERVVVAARTKKVQHKKLSSSDIQVSLGKNTCTVKFQHPVDFDKTDIKYSRQGKEITLRCPRAPQQFQKETPLFVVNPDRQLSLLPCILSADTLEGLSGQQFTKADRAIHKLCKGDFSQAPPLVSLKNTLMFFFQQRDVCFYQFLLPKDGVHVMVLVNKQLYDYENRVPVVDLAFCCLEESFVDTVVPIWITISSGQSCNLPLSNAEYKLMKEVFLHFAERTDATCRQVLDAESHLHLLTKHGIQKYFTRAVISLLLYNPDIYGQFMRDVGNMPKGASDQKQGLHETCDNCGNFFERTKLCSACKVAKYCTQVCQRRHWKVHKQHCKKKPALQLQFCKSSSPVFPLARYTYYGDFKYYYAYGNTPAEDFLQSCGGVREPLVLSLGCGDIRSCFYTLWKHFDSSISNAPKQFNGVHFVLNDCSSPVLARNIVFILLCIQLPENPEDRKKWLSAMWAVWYCHELYPHHQEVLYNCLKSLLKFSESIEMWVNADNPLCNIVSFTSPAVLAEISQVWKLWLREEISVEQMHFSRCMELMRCGVLKNLENHASSVAYNSVFITGDDPTILSLKVKARIPEIKSYINTGNCYAENIFEVDASTSPIATNLTLYERPAGVYTLHYGSLPFECYYHTVEFSPDMLKQSGVEKRLCNSMLVSSKSFKSHPLLANSVQQFSMWLQSASVVLNDKNIPISFTFNNQHALTFCQELQNATHNNQFSAIFSSNLMDHLGPPNVVLSALPLLKSKALLFTATLLYKKFSNTVEEYLRMCFGFDCELFPVILGTHCINHEGDKYASPVMIQPIPVNINHLSKNQQQQRVLIWEKDIIAHPIMISPSQSVGSVIVNALVESTVASAFSLLHGSEGVGLHVLNNNNIETAIHILQRFFSFVSTSGDHQFWVHLCATLKQKAKPFLSGLQIQALLHDFHIHLTVTEADCPICRRSPLSEYVGLFCAEVPLPLPVPYLTPCFMALVHKYTTSDSRYICTEACSGGDVHIIDSIDGTVEGKVLKLKFFAPLFFIRQKFSVTIAFTWMTEEGNVINTILPTSSIEGVQVEFVQHTFSKTASESHYQSDYSSFGKLITNIYDQDTAQSEISLSDSALNALSHSNLSTKKISSREIQLSCGTFYFNMKFKYPINYDGVKIKLSRTQKNVKIISSRQAQCFEEEISTYDAHPDHQLSLPPKDSDYQVLVCHSALQFTPEEEKAIGTASSRNSMTPLANVKETLMYFFQRKDEFHFHLTPYDGKSILGQVLVNKRVFDYERNAPAVDLAIFFPRDHQYPESVRKAWFSMIEHIESKMVTKIFVDDSEYEELRKVIFYLAKRTNGDLKSAGINSKYCHLVQHGVEKYFIRIVFYFLYCDPDLKVCSTREYSGKRSFPNEKCKYCGKFSDNGTKYMNDKIDYCKGDCQMRLKQSKTTNLSKDPGTKTSSGFSVDSFCTPMPASSQQRKCSFCNNSGMLKKCLRCGEAHYCDRDCQTKHWPIHKAECKRLARALQKEPSAAAPEISPLQPSTQCACCGISSVDLKLCTGCGKVKYCGRQCQTKHWNDHKSTCN